MKKYIPIIKKTKMFAGVSEEEIVSMISCLGATLIQYNKDECVFHQGEHLNNIAVVVEGKLRIQADDYWGNRSILGEISVGEMFGEAYVAPESSALLHNVVAVENSTVIFFDARRLISTCPSVCRFHTLVVQNMFYAIAEKNINLVQKLCHMSRRTTREKLISYLSEEANKQNSPVFTVPFNRQELADYLSVDRSAMSNELCKMRNEGLLEFEKSRFKLL